MKKLLIVPAFISLLFSAVYGDDPPRINTSLVLISPGYVINSGLGFVNYTSSTVAGISPTNPASMDDFNKIAVGMSFLFATPIDSAVNLTGIEHSRVDPLLPQNFGLVLPYRDFRIGVGFNQKYSSSLDFGSFSITTPGDPGGTGETYNVLIDRYVYSGSGMVSYRLPNFINDDHRLSLGLQVDVNFLKDYESIDRIKVEAKDQSVTWKAGIRYGFLDLLQLGVAFDKGANFEGKVEYEGAGFLIPDSGFVSQPIENKFTAKLPDRLMMGLAFKVADKIRLANDFTYVYWEKINSLQKNQLDISGNFYFLASEKLSLSAGFYSTKKEVKDSNNSPDDNAFFLSAGVLASLKSVEIEAVLADSHLFSSDTRKQTLARLSLGFSL